MGRQGYSLIIKTEHLSTKREHPSRKKYKSVEHVSHKVTDELSVRNFMRFESRERTFNQILEALQDDNISCVALYGMGGIGKTSLAKEIGKKAKVSRIFDMVVFIPVTTTPNVENIQDQIAEQFGLRLKEKANVAARRRRLSLRLREKTRVLIILDNVWQRLDLQEIGISKDGTQMGCKVLLTTRNRQVGYLTGCQHNFHIFLLTDEEAWNFFMTNAGIDDKSQPDLIAVAKETAKHCQGLPFAILAVASSVRGRDVGRWKHSLEFLWSPRGKGLNWEDDSSNFILQIIQVNYNALSSKVAKTISLICGLFPEDHEILIEDLSQYAVRLGLCAKHEARAAINNLKDCCLLMQSDKSKDHVIMHRLYRDTAVMIVYKENPIHRDNVREYMNALDCKEDFQWNEELDRLLRQLYGVTEYPSSSNSNAANGVTEHPSSSTSNAANSVTEYPSSSTTNAASNGGEGRELQVVRPYSFTKAATIPKPSGKLVDFYGLCQVDKLFLPLLKEACAMKPQLIESQRRYSEMLRQSAFDCLGRLLFLLRTVRNRDWVYYKHELQTFWEMAKPNFNLEWLSPLVEGLLSEIARIEALQEEEKYCNKEAAKLSARLKIFEDKAADVRTEIALAESKLNGFAITDVSKAQQDSSRTDHMHAWSFPLEGWVCLNTGGSVQHESRAACGGLIRDPRGSYMGGFACNLGVASILTAELMGVYHGLLYAWEKGVRRVKVEVDSHCVVSLIGSGPLTSHSAAPLVERINELRRLEWDVPVCHISTEENKAAHAMAKLGHSMRLGVRFYDTPPSLCEGHSLE